MGTKTRIAKKAAKLLFHAVCDNYGSTSHISYQNGIDMNTLHEALNYAEQICRTVEPTCNKEHLALFKSEVINYICSK